MGAQNDLLPWKNNQVLNYGKVATVPDGEQLSDVVDLGGMTLVGVFCPDALDGIDITFAARPTVDGPTAYDVTGRTGSVVTVAGVGSKYFALDAADFAGVRFLSLATSAGASGDAEVVLALRRV